tara:strand:+ start:30 stop:509 length:480 start_codon:yes stop_codon:yes gene_type:complete
MIYRIRVILDSKEDVIRDIEIHESKTFEDLHFAINNYFGFSGNEMASFYLSDDNWKQRDEIMLESFENYSENMLMKNTNLNSLINENNKKFIYIYDYLELWTFFIEVFDLKKEEKDSIYPKNIFSIGELPQKAPKKLFISDDNISNEFQNDNLDCEEFY